VKLVKDAELAYQTLLSLPDCCLGGLTLDRTLIRSRVPNRILDFRSQEKAYEWNDKYQRESERKDQLC
jgi:hypothetical protein